MDDLINWNQSHLALLKFLFLKCYISSCKIEIEQLLKGCFRSSEIGQGKDALYDLIRKKYVEADGKSRVSINRYFLPEIRRLIDSSTHATRIIDTQPNQNLIPDEYEKEPLFISRGDHASLGIVGSYYYFQKKSDSQDIMYIIVGTTSQTRKFLGSLRDQTSAISQVYRVAKKKGRFIKADFNTADLPHTIVENRQPIKAAIDVLDHFKLIRKTGSKRRTSEEYEITEAKGFSTSLDDLW